MKMVEKDSRSRSKAERNVLIPNKRVEPDKLQREGKKPFPK